MFLNSVRCNSPSSCELAAQFVEAKAMIKDLTFQASAKTKDSILRVMARTKDLTFKAMTQTVDLKNM